MNNVNLKPWVGKNYQQGIQGKKIMVLGESHYSDHECDENFTTKIIAEHFLNPADPHEGWKNTYTKFERALAGHKLSQTEREELWNSFLFYNYIQEPLTDPRIKPMAIQYQEGQTPFWEVLEKYKPDGVIVWGERLYNRLPQAGVQGEDIFGQHWTQETWQYLLSDGHQVSVMPIQHPSGGFSWDLWHETITKFISGC